MAKKNKALTSDQYMQEFTTLAAASPQDAAEVAMQWRERFMNQVERMRKSSEELTELGVAGVSAFGMGFFDGGWEAKRQALVDAWEDTQDEATLKDTPAPWDDKDTGIKDPQKAFGLVDKSLVSTLVFAGIAISNLAKKYTPVFRAAALGTGAYWAGSQGRKFGYNRKYDEALREEASKEVEEALSSSSST